MTIKEHTIIGQASAECALEKEPTDAKSLVEYIIHVYGPAEISIIHTHNARTPSPDQSRTLERVYILVVRQVDFDFLFE